MYEENRRRDPDDLFYPFQWGAILRQEGRPGDAALVLTEGLQRVMQQFEMRKLPAYSWSLAGQPERAAAALIGSGPPFGGYLSALTEELMLLHIGNDQPDAARDLGQAVLNGSPRFSGRVRIQTAVERLK